MESPEDEVIKERNRIIAILLGEMNKAFHAPYSETRAMRTSELCDRFGGFALKLGPSPRKAILEYLNKQLDELFDSVRDLSIDVDETSIQSLREFPNLKELHVYGTETTQKDLTEHISNLTQLTRLNISNTVVNNSLLKALAKSNNLETLDINCCLGITNAGLVPLTKLKKLKKLDISYTHIGDAGLEHIGKFNNLESLILSSTSICDDGLKHLGKLTNLEILRLDNTSIGDKGLSYLVNLTKLRVLSLSFTRITNDGLKYLSKMSDLRNLDLHQTDVSNKGIHNLNLRNLPYLEELDLRNTSVTEDRIKYLGVDFPSLEVVFQHEN